MEKKDLYKKYKKEKGVRIVNRNVFYTYLDKFEGYDNTISYLKQSKKTKNTKAGSYKRKNINEIIDFAQLFSVDKAAVEYDISERTIYRYINNQKKELCQKKKLSKKQKQS